MSTKTKTVTTEASAEDRQRVQGIQDDNREKNRGYSGSTTVPVDWQRQRSVDFPCYRVAHSNNV